MTIENNKNTKNTNKVIKDLHKMEMKMKTLDFSFLDVDNINVEVENQSLESFLLFIKGE